MYRFGASLIAFLILTVGPVGASVLEDLAQPRDYSSHRESSYDRYGGNGDGGQGNPIKPTELREIASIKGSGEIAHIWFTIAPFDKDVLTNLILRMYWDDEKTPSVEAPIGAFFGLGHGKETSFDSLPISVGNNRGLNCFFPMPFARNARVTIENQSKATIAAFYYYIDYKRTKPSKSTPLYFHAQYRQSKPALGQGNYVALDAKGRGHYVGMFYYIRSNSPGWWGEGDDMIYIDGASSPTLPGTGMEDYFCNAWGMKEGQNYSRFGAPLFEVYKTGWGNENTAYRWHLEDAIAFSKSIRVTHEHGSENDRNDDFFSVAFWYQTHPHAPFPKLGSTFERMAFNERREALTAAGDLPALRTMLGNFIRGSRDVEARTKAITDLAAAEAARGDKRKAAEVLATYQGPLQLLGYSDKAAEFAATSGIEFQPAESNSVWLVPCGDGHPRLERIIESACYQTNRKARSPFLYFAASDESVRGGERDLTLEMECLVTNANKVEVQYTTADHSYTAVSVPALSTGWQKLLIKLPKATLKKAQNCGADLRVSAVDGDICLRAIALKQ